MGRKKDQALALTTDTCTGASVVNNATIALLESTGNAYLASGASPGSVFYYNATMGFMSNVVLNLGFREGAPVSLWDAVTALILLGKKNDAQGQWLDKNLIALCVCVCVCVGRLVWVSGGRACTRYNLLTSSLAQLSLFWQVYRLIKA